MMGNKYRYAVFLVILLIPLSACNKTTVTIENEHQMNQDTDSLEHEVQQDGNVELSIYGMDTENFELKDCITIVPADQINAKTITNEVVKVFAEYNINIGLNQVIQKDKSIYVSFKKNGVPVKGVSTKVERVILEAISNSLLDNVEDCEKVFFRIENQKYQTEHIQLDLDTPYSW